MFKHLYQRQDKTSCLVIVPGYMLYIHTGHFKNVTFIEISRGFDTFICFYVLYHSYLI